MWRHYFEISTQQSNWRFWPFWLLVMFNAIMFDLIPSFDGEWTGFTRVMFQSILVGAVVVFVASVVTRLRFRPRARA
jgi:hypothetical protein